MSTRVILEPAAVSRGVLLVLAGTSGAGKGTLGRRLREQDPSLRWSVSWTTRPARPGEVPGRRLPLRHPRGVRAPPRRGRLPRVVRGLRRSQGHAPPVRRSMRSPRATTCCWSSTCTVPSRCARRFPTPCSCSCGRPSRDEQRRRLEARAADDPEAIERRLARAEAEEQIAQEQFDAVIVNDDVDRATAELAAIVESRRNGAR